MKIRIQEFLALVLTLIFLVGVPITVYSYAPWVVEDNGPRVIYLTGVQKSGVWTGERVNAFNLWWKNFQPATITIAEGEEVIIRLTSADVTHSFYVPELYPEPIIVEPGHTEELKLTGSAPGVYTYYCTTVCGDCHYSMRGSIVVGDVGSELLVEKSIVTEACKLHEPGSAELPFLDRGEYLFASSGCITCHGEGGQGGVRNPNYVKGTVPELAGLADRMWIYWEEDADSIIAMLEQGVDLATHEGLPPIENFGRFLAQYGSMRAKLVNGAPQIQKLDPTGPEPPLAMPAWETKLSSRDMDAIMAYLISVFDWSQYD